MDSCEGSSSVKNPPKLDGETENNRNLKNPSRQRGANDDGENVFTTMSRNDNSSQKTSRSTNLNSVSSNESGQSNKLNENSSDCVTSSASQSQLSNRLSCSSTDHLETPSSSREDSSTFDNGLEPNPELQTCQRHKVCQEKVGNTHNLPSTSGTNKPCDFEAGGYKESRKRPSSLKLNRPNLDEDTSSDTGNDDYSLGSEDGCIYTYRGGEHLADLPSSFFSLDMGLPMDKHLPMPPHYQVPQAAVNQRDRDSRASSPDMDFLEMDFDPGPSNEVDTGDESTPDAELEAAGNMPEEEEPIRQPTPENIASAKPVPVVVQSTAKANTNNFDVPSTSRGITSGQGDVSGPPKTSHGGHTYYGPYIMHVNAKGEQFLVRRTMSHWQCTAPASLHISNGNLISPREMLNYNEDHVERPLTHQINQGELPPLDSVNLSSALYHINMAKRLMVEKSKSDLENSSPNMAGDGNTGTTTVCGAVPIAGPSKITNSSGSSTTNNTEVPRCMVWSEREACERQVTQIGTSACGATAVVNVFIALGVPVNVEKINSAVGTRQRANNAPLARYLLSRAVAGCTAADLVRGIQGASDGLVTARFFPTYPERAVSLSHWLADWISLGAVPILTLNLQAGCEGEIPDAWHHQMVFGVSSRGVYLCNPAECVRETVLWPRLISPSVLLVRTRDVISRFNDETDLTPLMAVPDRRFHVSNVFGQVVNAIREWRATGWVEAGTRTRHVRVPCAYTGGVTLAALTGTHAQRRLSLAPQLPILSPQLDP